MSRIYYRGAKAAIVCYDLTDKLSFEKARFWVQELRLNEEVIMGHSMSVQPMAPAHLYQISSKSKMVELEHFSILVELTRNDPTIL